VYQRQKAVCVCHVCPYATALIVVQYFLVLSTLLLMTLLLCFSALFVSMAPHVAQVLLAGISRLIAPALVHATHATLVQLAVPVQVTSIRAAYIVGSYCVRQWLNAARVQSSRMLL
jgi:cadmium resistance protein CadD (predicted permease)